MKTKIKKLVVSNEIEFILNSISNNKVNNTNHIISERKKNL